MKVLNRESYLNEKKTPGYGHLWKNQINMPMKQKFNAVLRKTSPKDNEIRSLKKVKKNNHNLASKS